MIIDKMMIKEPKHRYEDCGEILRDLASLGIHSPAISFVDGAQPTGVGRSVAPTVAVGSKTMAGGGGAPVSSRADAKRNEKKKKSSRTWFVQYTTADGSPIVEKHSTARVLKMVKAIY